MNRRKIIIENGTVGLVSQFVIQILNFMLRKYVLKYIGVELSGLSSTLSSVISTMSLAELGFQQAVVFYLYQPLRENDVQKINCILMILKRVYEVIGVIFIGLSFIVSIFLDMILKGIIVDRTVVCYYFLICLNAVMTYFLSYRRAILYADQKEYISQGIDSIISIFAFLIKLVAIRCFKNFAAYLSIQVIQTVVSNVLVCRWCQGQYHYLRPEKLDKRILFTIFTDVRNVFVSKIAGFIYGATDNLIISVTLGTIQVGYLSNYVIFTSAIKQAVNSMFHSMTAIIGNLLSDKKDAEKQETLFRVYAYCRYLLASVIVIPWILLGDNLVQIFFGKEYILEGRINVLLAIDLYIHIVYSLCCEYINGSGHFRFDRNISIIGAIINLISSIVFAKRIGVTGVLVGTVISQVFFWAARSAGIYTKVFVIGRRGYLRYIVENIFGMAVIWMVIMISRFVNGFWLETDILASTIRMFIVCEVINLIVQAFIIIFSDKRQAMLQIFATGRRRRDDSN